MKQFMIWAIMILGILVVGGCKMHSMVVMENSDFPDDADPTDIRPEIFDKYSVGSVIVHPRIVYANSEQTLFKPFIVFFSKSNDVDVNVDNLTLHMNGEKICDYRGIKGPVSEWSAYEPNDLFYVCYIAGAPIETPKATMVKNGVEMLLDISSRDGGKVFNKRIESAHVAGKRSFLE